MAFVNSPVLRHTAFCLRPALSPASNLHPKPVWRVSGRTVMSQSLNIPENPTIGFIGLGVMGLPMAANLSSKFRDLVVWNRSDKTDQMDGVFESSANVTTVSTPADVIAASDLTFSMLSTPKAARAVYYDHHSPALSAITPGKAFVDCSTLQTTDMLATDHAVKDRGGIFLEAPVSGSKVPAEQGQLIFLCAGDKPLFDHPVLQTALDLMGKKSVYLGKVGNGTNMKLVVNQLMATMLAALGESIVLTEAADLSVTDLLDVLSNGAMNNPMFGLKGPKMQEDTKGYDKNFALEFALKDVRFAQALGKEHGVKMDVSSAAQRWYEAATDLGLSDADFCAVIESIRASKQQK